jgi:hypothetical protein
MGCLDTEITERPKVHIWRSDAAPWFDPKDRLPDGRKARRRRANAAPCASSPARYRRRARSAAGFRST